MLALGSRDPPSETAEFSSARGECKVFIYLHGRRSTEHGVLKNAADINGALVFRQAGNILPVDEYLSRIHAVSACNSIKHGGFSRSVAADDGYEFAVLDREIKPAKRVLCINGTGIKGEVYVMKLNHLSYLPLLRRQRFCRPFSCSL